MPPFGGNFTLAAEPAASLGGPALPYRSQEFACMFISSAYAQTASAGSDPQAMLTQILPLVLIAGVFYFLLYRPQQQRAKQVKAQQSGLRRGDKVITAGGIIGVVAKVVNDDEVEVTIAENVRVRVIKSTITTVLAKTEPASGGGKEPPAPKDTTADASGESEPAAAEGETARRKRTTRASTTAK
jgi:preprotein translocase subunit YajC